MVFTAILLGFAGSLHCVGMCSPLAMAVTNMTKAFFFNKLLYNGGRIFTYGIIGSVFSAAGTMFSLSKAQYLISVILGIALLLLATSRLHFFKIPCVTMLLQKLINFLKVKHSYFFKQKNSVSILLLGMINGLLPCGLTIIAFTYCVTLKGPLDGFNFMMLFGIGTLPAMLGLTSVIIGLVKKFKINTQQFNTGLMMLSGVLLIIRVFVVATMQAHQTGDGVIDIVLCL